ncbi:MAG: DUF4430 domain-containing protein [Lachnospiraceae bacterium]|nr:DUF4430 domain-containing protein [Lachnospiraceae bacterium]
MQKERLKKALSWILCMALIVAMALVTTGCSGNAEKKETPISKTEEAAADQSADAEVTVLGEGSKVFDFSVVDLDGAETWFEIHTDAETVGEALIALELIDGDEGPYGLYVKSVNGIQADYDKDKVYWAFYVNGEYGTTGVELTEIVEEDVYSFRMAK